MAVVASDDFDGLGTSNLTGRTLNNALGGSGSRSWVNGGGSTLEGNGSGGIVESSSTTGANIVSVSGDNYRARVRFDPSSATSSLALYGNRSSTGTAGTGVLVGLGTSHTNLTIREMTSGITGTTTHATQSVTAPGTTFWLELEIDGNDVVGRILNNDLSVRNTVSYTFGTVPSGQYWGFGFYQAGFTGVFDDFVIEDLAGGDVTAPVLTSAVGTETGATTATVGATTDEDNGTMYVVVTTSNTQPSIVQIKAGQDHTGAAAAFADDQVITTTGAKTFSATGLTASTTYYAHLVHADAAANDSNRITSASFTTDTPDTTAPTLTSPTAVSISNVAMTGTVSTDEANGTLYMVATTSATPPTATQIRAGQDHTGAAAVFADDQAIGSTGVKTFNVTGLTELTTYYLYYHHRDASNNDSTVSTASDATFRDGDTAANIIANTAPVGDGEPGILYALALTKDADDWLSWFEVTPPDPSGGTLDANPDGSFTYTGPEPATWIIQAETNGVEEASTTEITLYDQPEGPDETAPVLTAADATPVGSSAAFGEVTTDEDNGTLYYVATANATETAAYVIANGATRAVTAIGVQNVTFLGLTAETAYYGHFVHVDDATNESNRISTDQFTTGAVVVGGLLPVSSRIAEKVIQPIARRIARRMT